MGLIFNTWIRKGGSTKTTTVINLSYALAQLGQKVLIVDSEPQCDISKGLDIEPLKPTTDQLSIADILINRVDPKLVIVPTNFGFDLIPSRQDLSKIEKNMDWQDLSIYRILFAELKNEYDFIFFDSPPNDQFITTAILAASDYSLLPIQAQKFAISELPDTFEAIQTMCESFKGVNVKIYGILPTMIFKGTQLASIAVDMIKEMYPDLLLPYLIYNSSDVQKAQMIGQPLQMMNPNHASVEAYNCLSTDLISLKNKGNNHE